VTEKNTKENKQTKKLLRSDVRRRNETLQNILIDGEICLFTFDSDIFDRWVDVFE
jgi:hypothetical protein